MIKASMMVLYHYFAPTRSQNLKETHTFSRMVFPWHLDLNFHVNNARYLNFCNQARLVFLARLKVLNMLQTKQLTPVIFRNDITYYKSLKLFDLFTIETTMGEIQKDQLAIKHIFMKDQIKMAELTSYVKLYAKEGRVDHLELLNQYFK